MPMTTVGQPPRARRRRLLLTVPLLSTAFGAVSGAPVDATLPMAGFGLAWGIGAIVVAPRLARRGTKPSAWSDVPAFVALPLAFVVLGAALLGNLLATTPQAQLDLLQQSTFGFFFYAIHALFEWALLPVLLAFNWHRPARRWLLVAAAAAFYAGRVASGLYFAPNAMDWGEDPTIARPEEVQLWMNLNWIRLILQDTVTAVLLLLAVALPHDADRPRRPR